MELGVKVEFLRREIVGRDEIPILDSSCNLGDFEGRKDLTNLLAYDKNGRVWLADFEAYCEFQYGVKYPVSFTLEDLKFSPLQVFYLGLISSSQSEDIRSLSGLCRAVARIEHLPFSMRYMGILPPVCLEPKDLGRIHVARKICQLNGEEGSYVLGSDDEEDNEEDSRTGSCFLVGRAEKHEIQVLEGLFTFPLNFYVEFTYALLSNEPGRLKKFSIRVSLENLRKAA